MGHFQGGFILAASWIILGAIVLQPGQSKQPPTSTSNEEPFRVPHNHNSSSSNIHWVVRGKSASSPTQHKNHSNSPPKPAPKTTPQKPIHASPPPQPKHAKPKHAHSPRHHKVHPPHSHGHRSPKSKPVKSRSPHKPPTPSAKPPSHSPKKKTPNHAPAHSPKALLAPKKANSPRKSPQPNVLKHA